jgi:hypothetical protein
MALATFKSSQTESEYTVVNSDPAVQISYRVVQTKQYNKIYRVRIQCKDHDILMEILSLIPSENRDKWGEIKDDHISIVVTGEAYLAHAVGDATQAVTFYQTIYL